MVHDVEYRLNNWTVFFRDTINYERLVKHILNQPLEWLADAKCQHALMF